MRVLRSLSFLVIVVPLSRARAQDQSDYWVDVGPAAADGAPSSTLRGRAQEIPPTYGVRRGDTLWQITGHFYGDPYDWPRVWSYNPEITNPHWIYPEQQVRLLPADGTVPTRTGSRIPRAHLGMPAGSIYLREQGWLDRDALEASGEIVGSPDDHMMLSPFDRAYLHFDEGTPSGEYTVFRALETSDRIPGEEEGTIVRILGTVRVDEWNPERKLARATVVEALDPLERGFRVATLPRRFEMVPAVASTQDAETRIVATLMSTRLVGDQQIVFAPLGQDDGVRMGNRFLIVRAGDPWREELARASAENAAVPPPDEPQGLPDEVVAEARVVGLRPHSATLLVTRATTAVQVGDRAQLRAGY